MPSIGYVICEIAFEIERNLKKKKKIFHGRDLKCYNYTGASHRLPPGGTDHGNDRRGVAGRYQQTPRVIGCVLYLVSFLLV